MDIVPKFKKDETPKSIRELSGDEVALLRRVFVERKPKKDDEISACVLADEIRDGKAWIRCDCKNEKNPLMTFALSDGDSYHLMRINHRGMHTPDCKFKGIDYADSAANKSQHKRVNKNKPLCLHRRGKSATPQGKPSAKPKEGGKQSAYHRLARTLYDWIEESRLNLLSIEKTSIVEQLRQLKAVTKNYKFEKGVNANEFVFTYPNVEQIVTKLEQTADKWQGKRPYAVCICIADRIEENTAYFDYKQNPVSVTFSGTVTKSSGRLGKESAPYLIIFTVTDASDNVGVYKPFDAYYVPVYSKFQLIPVDSRYERDVLKKITGWGKWWKDSGLQVYVKKPLFDIKVRDEDKMYASKPDVLFITPKSNVILEVMGSHEETYVERKERVRENMEAIGDVVDFDALEAEKENTWDATLKQKLKQVSKIMFDSNLAQEIGGQHE